MSSTRPDAAVSVLMPTFNRARYIGEAIESILAQSHAPHEVLVLDDGSSEDTAGACARFGDAVRVIHLGENKGKSSAINRGLELATGAYVWVMDDDDVAPPDALATLLAPMLASPRVGFTFGRLLKFEDGADGGKVFEAAAAAPPTDHRRLFVRLMEDCFITGQPCVLFRRACFDAVGPIDPSVLASVDYNILLQVARRFDGADVDKVVLWQRQHRGLRGPAQLRYSARQRVERWMAFDARLLGELLPTLAPEEFLGEPPSGRRLSRTERRRGLFQKAAIAARKTLWDLAVLSLTQARGMTEAGLNPADRLILSQALGSRYGIDGFIDDPALQRRLIAAAGPGALGREIRAVIASRLTYWIGRAMAQVEPQRLARTLVAFYRVAGPDGSMRLASAAVLRKLGLGGAGGETRPQQRGNAAPVPAYDGGRNRAQPAR